MSLNITLSQLDGYGTNGQFDVSFPVKVVIENDTASEVTVAGIKLINVGGKAANIVLGDFGMFNGFPSGSFGPSPSPTIVSGNMNIAAGATGSYLSAIVPKWNGPLDTLFAYTQYTLQSQVTLLGNPTVYSASSDFVFDGFGPNPEGVACITNTPVWNLRTNTTPATNFDFDAVVQTVTLNPAGVPDYLPVNLSLNNYSSSNTAIATVVQKGAYSATTSSYALTNSVGSVLGGQETQLIGGGGAVKFVGGTGVVTITNALFPGVTGSCKILVQSSNPVSLTVFPARANLTTGTNVQAQAILVYADGTTTDVSSVATWASSNPSAVTTNGTGFLTAAAGVGQSSTISAKYLGLVGTATVTSVSTTPISVTPASVPAVSLP